MIAFCFLGKKITCLDFGPSHLRDTLILKLAFPFDIPKCCRIFCHLGKLSQRTLRLLQKQRRVLKSWGAVARIYMSSYLFLLLEKDTLPHFRSRDEMCRMIFFSPLLCQTKEQLSLSQNNNCLAVLPSIFCKKLI